MVKSLAVLGFSVRGVLDDATLLQEHRNLDVVELWSGVAAIVTAARARGLRACPYDRNRIPGVTDDPHHPLTEDITCKAGLTAALRLVLRLRSAGTRSLKHLEFCIWVLGSFSQGVALPTYCSCSFIPPAFPPCPPNLALPAGLEVFCGWRQFVPASDGSTW